MLLPNKVAASLETYLSFENNTMKEELHKRPRKKLLFEINPKFNQIIHGLEQIGWFWKIIFFPKKKFFKKEIFN